MVTAQVILAFVFAYAKRGFSHDATQIIHVHVEVVISDALSLNY